MIDPSLFSKLNDLKSMAEESRKKMDNLIVQGESGNGLVTISLNGNRELKNLTINTDCGQISKEDLEDLLTVALSRALNEANRLNEQETLNAAKNILPGL